MENKKLGETLRNYRLAKGVSLEEVANACHVNRSTVCRWEKGYNSRISYGNRIIRNEMFGLPTSVFLGDGLDGSTFDSEVEGLRYSIGKTVSGIKDTRILESIDVIVKALAKTEDRGEAEEMEGKEKQDEKA